MLIDPLGGVKADAAVFEARSATQGLLVPRVTLTALNQFSPPITAGSPVISLLVYNSAGTLPSGYYYWDGSNWQRLLSGSGSFPTGTGTTDYLARWTPDGSTLGIGATRDNGSRVGIGAAPHGSYRLQVAGDVLLTSGWLRTTGSTGWQSETHGGGIFMQDATWIRTSGNKGFYHNTGNFRTDGTLQVGSSGATLNVPNNGNFAYKTDLIFGDYANDRVGIKTGAPTADLDINGVIRIRGGAPAAGKVLVSTADGTASWSNDIPGSDNNYIWNQTGQQASSNFHISAIGIAGASFRAPIFYDNDNTAYYGDFAGASRVNEIMFDDGFGYGCQYSF